MGFLSYFRSKKSSASTAKERLQIIVAQERTGRGGPDYLPLLKEELLLVIRKYVHVDPEAVRIALDKDGDYEILELNVTLPESSEQPAQESK